MHGRLPVIFRREAAERVRVHAAAGLPRALAVGDFQQVPDLHLRGVTDRVPVEVVVEQVAVARREMWSAYLSSGEVAAGVSFQS